MSRLTRSWRVIRDAFDRFNRHDGFEMAGFIAFSGLLSIFPFLIFAATLIGMLVGESRSEQVIEALFQIAPSHVAMTIEPVIVDVLSNRSSEVLTLSALFAILVASNAVEAFRVAFDRAYNVIDPRSFLQNRMLAIGIVFVGAFVAALLGVSIILSPILLRFAEQTMQLQVPGSASYVTYGFGVAVFMLFVRAMHRTLPGRRVAGARLWPGVFFTTGAWLLAASGFTYYLSSASAYTVTYGTLAGVIITLMFFYISGLTIIFGAEVNAALNRLDPPER